MTPEELQAALTTARLRVNDWHACASAEELARWRADQASLIIAAKASVYPEVEALSAKLQEAEKEIAAAREACRALDDMLGSAQRARQDLGMEIDDLRAKLQEVQAERDDAVNNRNDILGTLQEIRAERDKLELERDEKAAIIQAVGHELDELRARAESAKARQAAAEHRAQRVLLEIEASRGEVVRPFVGSNGLVDEAALATTVSGILGTYARGEVVKANADIFANEPSEQLDTACHCGYTPERTPVYGTKCPIIAHRARSGKQWRDEYIERFRACDRGEVVKACPHCEALETDRRQFHIGEGYEDANGLFQCPECGATFTEPALWRRVGPKP